MNTAWLKRTNLLKVTLVVAAALVAAWLVALVGTQPRLAAALDAPKYTVTDLGAFPRGCYELWLRSDSMRACRTESLTQVTFPTKNGRLSPLTWRSLEKTLPSAPTICERFSTA